MDTFFIICAKYLIVVPVLILGIYFLKQPRTHWKDLAIFAIGSAVLAYIVSFVAGHLYFDPRPFVVDHITPLISHAPDNGFPSDHALLAAAIASIGWVWNKRLGVSLWILALLIAYARVYVGVHHMIDVLGSIVISGLATYAVLYIHRRVMNRNTDKISSRETDEKKA
jgi:undecaprenyl-diphosphatase